ncbi:MAG: tRNA pseudouridine(38-40) synthase TruA [Selenomonadaceae bacterium]|nr:tRNA pseudouridine(38-40) synthase TruA [Selenomonadaceae bacterium]
MRQENKSAMKLRRRNIALTVAYDGTNYNGFQWQSPPRLAVQNILETKLEKIFGDKIELAAAGRTDAGVHAFGQVVNFFTDGRIEIEKIPIAARSVLPADIVVREAREVEKNFSALHSAKSKIYLYRILRGEVSNPFVNRFAWHIFRPLDAEAMRAALKILIGTHDFSSFRAAGGAPNMNPVREIFAADLFTENFFGEELLTIKIHASGFLYHMARNIVALTVAAGRKKITLADFQKIFDARDRSLVPATAPARGLCLQEVFY